ncbi:MAG: energy-coupling factor ABC transporter ATP-binding protein [Lactobacillales bacterium]|jgi:energy-coupling factor transport system ATP-binding protein|nr:energy-coupling factor ABC transporter ATP-binding protein [Lactobacillales bacterium]
MKSPIIKFKNITYTYPSEKKNPALKNISYTVNEGEWIAIIGRNGSGKSTSAKIINGLLAADSGQIFIEGNELTSENVWNIRRKIGMVFQNPDNQFVGTTVEDDVAFGMENIGIPRKEMIERVASALAEVRMSEFATHEPAHLSGGQKQRIAIAGILALSPKILVLDEATSMLDPEGRIEVLQTIHQLKEKKNLTVLSITHDIEEAANADRIFVMNEGELIRIGTPAEIFQESEQLTQWGLELPFFARLKEELSKKGIEVPTEYFDEERLVDWLWTSILKK